MSFSNPFIKEIKKNVYHLTINQPVTDNHPNLQPFCEQLEILLRKDLKQNSSIFDASVRDYWKCIESFSNYLTNKKIRCHPLFEIFVKRTKTCTKITTDQGRGRFFLRSSLQNKFLDNIIQLLSEHLSFLNNWYYSKSCCLFDSIHAEILLSLLRQISELKFELCLQNCSFLDETWTIPVFKVTTLVPCRNLGIEILHKNGHSIVLALCKASVAAENGEIEAGDVLDEIFNKPLKNSTIGTISTYLRQFRDKPVELALVKSKLTDGSVFRPVAELIKELPLDVGSLKRDADLILDQNVQNSNDGKNPPHARLLGDDDEEVPVHNGNDQAQYDVQYMGSSHVGQDGSVCQIEQAINKVTIELQNQPQSFRAELYLGETELVVFKMNSEMFLRACYTEISSCGRKDDLSEMFACIVGETTCTLAKDFVAHVFRAKNVREAKIILCTIAQGFERTHWFV